MDIETVMTCSRGNNDENGKAKCRYVKDDKLYVCSAYIAVSGRHPQTGKDLDEEWRCVDQWTVIGLLEAARTNRGQTAAIESFRNEMVEGNQELNKLLLGSGDAKALSN